MTAVLLFLVACTGPGSTPGGDTSDTDTDSYPTIDEAPPAGTNLLVILADDMGVDKVAAYGVHDQTPQTPRLDQLIDEGMRFENAYSHPVCSPTRAAMVTGRYPRRHGIVNIIWNGDRYGLPPDELGVPEILGESSWFDYSSSLTGKWHLNAANADWAGVDHPVDFGFEWHAGSNGNPKEVWGDYSDASGLERGFYNWQKNTNGSLAMTQVYMTTDTVDDAIARMEAMPEPWLLWVTFNAPHVPLHAPPDELYHTPLGPLPDDYALYDAMVEAMDTEMGRLLDNLGDRADRTTVVFLGDNGTQDHAIRPPLDPGRNKGTLYEGGVRVPFVVSGPLVAYPGSSTDALVHAVDLMPTFAEVAGVDLSQVEGGWMADQPLVYDGRSFLPLLADPDSDDRRDMVYNEILSKNGGGPDFESNSRSVRDDRYKLIRRDRDGYARDEEFFEFTVENVDEGPDLLAGGLTVEQQAAYDALAEELEAVEATLIYEGI